MLSRVAFIIIKLTKFDVGFNPELQSHIGKYKLTIHPNNTHPSEEDLNEIIKINNNLYNQYFDSIDDARKEKERLINLYKRN